MTSFLLKLLALITMTIDHSGAMLMALGHDTMFMRIIGRAAFPIYAFLIAEGVRKTRSQWKYLLRLAAFALVSEIAFDLFVGLESGRGVALFSMAQQNVFFTLAAGAGACVLYDWLKPKSGLLAGLAVLGIAFAAEYLHTDYGFFGVIAIAIAFLCKDVKGSAIAVTGIIGGMYLFGYGQPLGWQFAAVTAAAGACLLLYNGAAGPRPVWMKWLFYAYYPLHLLALSLYGAAIMGLMH